MLHVNRADNMMHEIIRDSFRNFHTKGLDYLCLRRTHDLTVKVYFFDNECVNAGEIVYPHDHRYDFATTVLAGALSNCMWTESPADDPDAHVYQRFDYRTPLNGGTGFIWDREVGLRQKEVSTYGNGQRYLCAYDDIHTLAHVTPGTVITLFQYRDIVPLLTPSHTYGRDREPPSLSGLYDKHSPDQIIARVKQLDRVAPQMVDQFGLRAFA